MNRRIDPRATISIAFAVLASSLCSAGVRVEAARIDGSTVSGEVLDCSPELRLSTGDSDVRLAWSDLLSVRNVVAPAAPPNSSTSGPLRFALSDGSTFAASISSGAERGFDVEPAMGGKIHLEFDVLRSIRSTAATAVARQKIDALLAEGETDTDIAVVSRGDQVLVLTGATRGVTPERLSFEWNGKVTPIAWDRIAGVLFARPTPRGASCLLTTMDGDSFAGRVTGGDGESITLQSSVFDRLSFSWNRVAKIECRSDRYIFVSDLKPQAYRCESFFDREWALGIDTTLLHRPISIGGRNFAKGLVMHSRSEATFRIEGAFAQFAATAGISDEMRERGCVSMRVVGDGRVLWEAEQVRGGAAPRDVLVSVRGIRDLTLQVDFDDDLDLGDHAVWAFARLLR